MTARGDLRLIRLLQLASPTLPVGAFSYSQGLESAVEAGVVHDARSAGDWILDMLRYSQARTEAPLFLRMCDAWQRGEFAAALDWNAEFLATREAAELRAETVQMGYSMRRLLADLGIGDEAHRQALNAAGEPSFPLVFSCAVAAWRIEVGEALLAYLWAWTENQVMAAIKAVPLGQTEGQRLLLEIGSALPGIAESASALPGEDIGSFAPGLALAATRHETQYSRIFRS